MTTAPILALAPAARPRASLLPPPPVLQVRGLSRSFGPGCRRCADLTGHAAGTSACPSCGTVVAVHEVSFEVGAGEVLGVVGESGSGKTTLLRSLHLDETPDRGQVEVLGYGDLLTSRTPRSELRRSAVVMVHQNALAAGLSPALAAESNVAERLLHTGVRDLAQVRERVAALLTALDIPAARHQDALSTFSGGMKQRVQLARALVEPPSVLLLDEPTTGLDPSVQAGLLEAVQDVADRLGAATVVVSHDLGVVEVLADRVVVLHHGRVVEHGLTDQVLEDPQHPYTQLLISSRLA
ncbi:ATP-binding cassette domain-containing protein [Actinotalea sp. C106]|uniref:ATP-binding cassette domain-containing protein n=1 Tax=Actinotalea sp. C106 TaxID=2908644 RepID=UPI0020297F6D|nr:ATP-binding cassette domain-containing protein [Actinotalea sp. C106]